jgi:transposase
VRIFGTYTADLHALADWLTAHHIRSVAAESTGVYWIPVFEVLEARGFECCLISVVSIRRIPGRKSDVLDCQWIQTIHSYGLLADSFRPEADLIALRTLLRHRAKLIQQRSPHILRMQKALIQMNIQLSQVLSDVTGKTGLTIIRAIVAGERDPHKLAALRNYRCKKSEEEIALALTGTWREEHLFVLKQSLEFFDFYTSQIEACDEQIDRTYGVVCPDWGLPEDAQEAPPPRKRGSHSKNEPAQAAAIRQHIHRICGVDLVALPGFSVSIAQIILSEVGSSLQRFQNVKAFCSWLGLAPHNDISGGKVLRSRTFSHHNRARQALIQAAASLIRSDTPFGAFYRRKKSQIGPAQALIATAHKLARVLFVMLKFKKTYQPASAAQYEQKRRQREIARLRRKAKKLGLLIVAPDPPTAVS